jgi:ssRNA-specific RNase YbeY (16S rRNA maturation enzyme)
MFQITNLTKLKITEIPWVKIKDEILGKKYELSLVFTGNALIKKLNIKYRRKNKPASVLSFPISKKQGEIFVNLSQKKYSPFYLFIHGLLHLKSFKHSAKMEAEEERLLNLHHGA